MKMILALVASTILSAVLTMLVRRIALRIGFVDRPGAHKQHDAPIALGGGVALFWSVALIVLGGGIAARMIDPKAPPSWFPEFLIEHLPGMAEKFPLLCAIVAGALVLHVLGLIDDAKALGPWIKLAIQFVVAGVIVGVFGVRAADALGDAASIALTTLWIVLIVNAFNFLDNIDGLSAGVGAIAAIIFAAAAFRGGQIFVPMFALVLAGSLIGFLLFNFAPASVFMGDAGSMVIGYFLAVLTVMVTYYNPDAQGSLAGTLMPLVVLAVPLYDVVSVCVHRLRAGVSPFRGDRRHFSHRLVARGMGTRAAVLTIYLATAATSLSAILLPRADWTTAALVFAQTICVVLIIAILESRGGDDRGS